MKICDLCFPNQSDIKLNLLEQTYDKKLPFLHINTYIDFDSYSVRQQHIISHSSGIQNIEEYVNLDVRMRRVLRQADGVYWPRKTTLLTLSSLTWVPMQGIDCLDYKYQLHWYSLCYGGLNLTV